jgi:hypothetical protein
MKETVKLIRRGNKLFIVWNDNTNNNIAWSCAAFSNAKISHFNGYENALEINLGE